MKFSILALLAATGYVALLIASFQQPLSLWRYAVMAGWLAIMAYVFMLAVSPMNRFQAMFGRVVIGCTATYLVATALVWVTPLTSQRTGVLPHELLTERWTEPQSYTTASPPIPAQYYAPIPVPNSAPLDESDIPAPSDDPWEASPAQYAAPVSYTTYSYTVPTPITTFEAIAAMNCAILFGFIGGGLAMMRCRRVERAQAKEKRLATINPLQEAEVSADGNY